MSHFRYGFFLLGYYTLNLSCVFTLLLLIDLVIYNTFWVLASRIRKRGGS